MTGLRGMLTGLVLGSALISSPAIAQGRSSVSLTHMVTVTVPPRIKVQVSTAAPIVQYAANGSSVKSTISGLAVSVRATQSWTLSTGSADRNSVVASGTNSQDATAATVYFQNEASNRTEGSAPVTLTVAAQ